MTGPRHPSANDLLESALGASCDAQITLEVMRRLPPQDQERLRPHVTRAIESLQVAIAELRAAVGESPGALAQGFVAGRSAPITGTVEAEGRVEGEGPPRSRSKPGR
jgi:hypothetical protein